MAGYWRREYGLEVIYMPAEGQAEASSLAEVGDSLFEILEVISLSGNGPCGSGLRYEVHEMGLRFYVDYQLSL